MKQAAGILFIAEGGKVLVGRRAELGQYEGHWGIFGGHHEEGETLELTALREVLEETGHVVEGPVQLIAQTQETGTEFTYFVNFCNRFEPELNWEHTEYQWLDLGEFPLDGPLIPGLAEVLSGAPVTALRKSRMNERNIAEAMARGALPSPQKYANITMYKMRVTGTGTSFRRGYTKEDGTVIPDEHVYRRPENYLTQEFLDRCNGLPVIYDHPDKKTLDSKEFNDRKIGSIVLAFIEGDEVWGIGRIYDASAIAIMDNLKMSTSPTVVFLDKNQTRTIELNDGSHLLIEGTPDLLDHLAVCEHGVWDKGGPPVGVVSETARADSTSQKAMENVVSTVKSDSTLVTSEDAMSEEELKAKADAEAKAKADAEEKAKADKARADSEEKIAKMCDAVMARMDSIEKSIIKMDTAATAADKARADAEEKEKEEKAKADAEEKAKADAEEKEKEEAKAKADAEEKEKEEKAKADAEEARADSARKIEALEKQLAHLTGAVHISDADRAVLADIQARADGVMSLFGVGNRASMPQPGETPLAYRQRLATGLKQHSAKWKNEDLMGFSDSVLAIAEADIYADAERQAAAPADLPAGTLREVVKADRTGRKISEFVGSKGVWMDQFKAIPQLQVKISNGSN